MKQAIRDDHDVVRHEEFPDSLLKLRNAALRAICLDSGPTAVDRLGRRNVHSYPNPHLLVRKLLARGLDPHRPDWLGKTFLHVCAESGDRSTAAVLLDAGADINVRDLEFQVTPLAAAVRTYSDANPEHAERTRRMVEFLLQRGAATNLPDDEPWATPLAWAVQHGNDAIVDLLKQHGAT